MYEKKNQMKYLVLAFIAFFFCIVFVGNAQVNLVPNGSFEEYSNCPTSFANINDCKFWFSPTFSTPDYFNYCTLANELSVPSNLWGKQEAHTGNAYSYFCYAATYNILNSYGEYVSVHLCETLNENSLYHLKFYVASSSQIPYCHSPPICGNSVGAFLSQDSLKYASNQILTLKPQVQTNIDAFICNENWIEISQLIVGKGIENYLTIGVFTNDNNRSLLNGNVSIVSPNNSVESGYYLDDVSLVKIDIPNIFTPNDDGVNDSYLIDLEGFGVNSIRIYNRWGDLMVRGESKISWDGKYQGENCPDGVYFIQIHISNQIIYQFIHLKN